MEKEKFVVRKASDLTKRSITKEEIYNSIANHNNMPCYKHAIPPEFYISEEVIVSMINDGFKVYRGDMMGWKDTWIIEW